MEVHFLDSESAIKTFLNQLGQYRDEELRLYLDLEGNNLSRHGTLSLITVLLEITGDVYLVDVTTLGPSAFSTSDDNGRDLKAVLESSKVVKVFFDIRNDSDALYNLHNIGVDGIEDIQLMELASRTFDRRTVNGLARCIERDGTMTYQEKREWQEVKDRGKNLFDPARGGSYTVFDERPLSEDMKRYCVQDVAYMPILRETYRLKLCDAWWRRIAEETKTRVRMSQSHQFQGKGRHMALGPPGWRYWNPSFAELRSRTLFLEDAARVNVGNSAVSSTNPYLTTVASDQTEELTTIVERLKLEERYDSRDHGVVHHTEDTGRLHGISSLEGTGLLNVSGVLDGTHGGPSGYDDHDSCDSSIHGRQLWDSADENDNVDYTACDLDCGYCGRCGY
ncbi:Hypothetical protein D9617_55g071540 [Elsinoe fawcettii]|nr:Hypothetical protein D9617_55g071540 [Elsinoe fawcettii]